MTLRLYPAPTPYDSTYESLLASIPSGRQWHLGPVTLPLSADRTSFILEGNEGDVVEVSRNGTLVTRVVLSSSKQSIDLFLERGKNFLSVRSETDQWLILVVATDFATITKGAAQEYFFNSEINFNDAEAQLNSDLSLRHTEHQIEFQEYLPSTRATRVLAGKLAVRSLINETGSTRGVDDIVTAVSNTTPLVRETVVNRVLYEPSVYTVYSQAHDSGGYEFHVWVPNLCIGTWAAFVKLMDNLDPSIAELTSVSDEKVSLNYLGLPESHIFDTEAGLCSVIPLLTTDCLPITVSVSLRSLSSFAFCAWRYPFDVVSELALGRSRLDNFTPFSESVPFGSILDDITGSVTGIPGSSYVTLSRPPRRISSVTSSDPLGASLLSSFFIPGTRTLVLVSGNPGRDITVRYETSIPFDIGLALDSCEESDPLCDGWYGTPLVNRFDGGSCLDTTVPETSLFEDLECCFDRPQATLLGSSLATISLSTPITSFASLIST
tara:strand:- start:2043 stop:3524 length:1482 start_codon:yes stop_codon:yes gene_type:complete